MAHCEYCKTLARDFQLSNHHGSKICSPCEMAILEFIEGLEGETVDYEAEAKRLHAAITEVVQILHANLPVTNDNRRLMTSIIYKALKVGAQS